jgi:butyrate kinase
MRILAINPGSTSTKFGVYDDLNEVLVKTLRHTVDELYPYPRILDQYEFRKNIIIDALQEEEIPLSSFDVVVARGGLIKPIPGGVYKVNDILIDDLKKEILGEHASNLGALIAREIVQSSGKDIDAFIVDPVVVDEMEDIARYSGNPLLPRQSIFHALNQKAVARRYAHDIGVEYKDLSLIVVHLGGGISVGVHKGARVIDVNNGLDGEGPFSPERSGSVPVGALVKLCFSGRFQMVEIRKMIIGKGGLVGYFGTNSAQDIEERVQNADVAARIIYEAMAYQVAKEIGSCATVLKGKVDAILITGGLAYSKILINWITDRVSFISKVMVYPGEDEIHALVEGVYYAHKGEIEIKEYV